jgi:hypothetical protein
VSSSALTNRRLGANLPPRNWRRRVRMLGFLEGSDEALRRRAGSAGDLKNGISARPCDRKFQSRLVS